MIIVLADGVCPNDTHEVRPMKGGIVQPSTETFTSVLGDVTLKTRSASMNVPLSPVSSSMRVRSCLELCASATPASAASAAAIAQTRVLLPMPLSSRSGHLDHGRGTAVKHGARLAPVRALPGGEQVR